MSLEPRRFPRTAATLTPLVDTLGVIPATGSFGEGGSVGPMTPLLGAPLTAWAIHALLRALPPERVVVVAGGDPEDATGPAAIARRMQVRLAGPDDDLDGDRFLFLDPARPFTSRETVEAALAAGAREVETFRLTPLERIRVVDERDLELARAVAAGLPPGHPCIVGTRALPLRLGAGGAIAVRAVVSDVDGVLTTGAITLGCYGPQAGPAAGVGMSRAFHIHDGMGVQLLAQAGVPVGWLSAGVDDGVIRRRAEMLGVARCDVGPGDKGARFAQMCADLGVAPDETLYIGDDVNDLPAIARAGVSACPADARPEVRSAVDVVLEGRGGAGCFREAADMVLDLVGQTRD